MFSPAPQPDNDIRQTDKQTQAITEFIKAPSRGTLQIIHSPGEPTWQRHSLTGHACWFL